MPIHDQQAREAQDPAAAAEEQAAKIEHRRAVAALRKRVASALMRKPGPVRGNTAQAALRAARRRLEMEDADPSLFAEALASAGYRPEYRKRHDTGAALWVLALPEG